MSPAPRVELLLWRECPSWERAIEIVREEMQSSGLDPQDLEVREIDTESEADREAFPGSPTIRVNERDVQPSDSEATGLICRVYRLRDGRVSPLPDRADVRAALAAALEGEADE